MAKYNIENIGNAFRHLRNIKADVVVHANGYYTSAEKGLHSILLQGRDKLKDTYVLAASAGVENTDEVFCGFNIQDGWGRVFAEGKRLFFAEFGTGVNLNRGTATGTKLGYTPASWSLSAEGKGYLTGNRYVIFKGWWPVKEGVPNAREMVFATPRGKLIRRRAVQGNAPVNGAEAAFNEMHRVAAETMKHFFEINK